MFPKLLTMQYGNVTVLGNCSPSVGSWLRPYPGRAFFVMRTIILFDGQNLFRSAKAAWGPSPPDPSSPYDWPSYDVQRLAQSLVSMKPGRVLTEIRFYTGVYSQDVNPGLYAFWTNKLDFLESQRIYVYRGRVSNSRQEKGVDVSLAMDLIRATYDQRYDVAIIVSQDSDFGPAVRLAKDIAKEQGRALVFESAFPVGPGTRYRRAVPGTDRLVIDKDTYDSCHDLQEYRPPRT